MSGFWKKLSRLFGSQPPAENGLLPVTVPEELPVLPLRNSVMFPGGVLPMAVGRPSTVELVERAMAGDQLLLIVTQRNAEDEVPTPISLYGAGVVAKIVKLERTSDEQRSLLVHGLGRARIVSFRKVEAPLMARMETFEATNLDYDGQAKDLDELRRLGLQVASRLAENAEQARNLITTIQRPDHLADLIAANIEAPLELKQQVLETMDLRTRIALVLQMLQTNLKQTKPALRVVSSNTEG